MQSGRSWDGPARREERHTALFLTAAEAEGSFFHHDCEVAFVCVATVKLVFLQYYLNLNMYRKEKRYQKKTSIGHNK